MTARRKASSDATTPEGFSLTTLLSDAGDSKRDTYGDTNSNVLRRLTYAACELGGMVTYFYDSANQRLCFSVRVGSEKKSYQCETAEQFNQQAEQFIERVGAILLKMGKAPPPPLDKP